MSKFDDWLERYPRLDVAYSKLYMRIPRPVARIKRAVRDWQAAREWQPGTFYLDHGTHPCVLTELRDGDDLHGVSLVDGSIKMGCSIYHCGPFPVARDVAFALAERIREEERQYHYDKADASTKAFIDGVMEEIATGEELMKEFRGDM